MKIALVTGGSRGIGKAICIRLAEMGFHIIINYRSDEAQAQDTLAQVIAKGTTAELMPFDIGNQENFEKAMDEWYAKNPDKYISVLVNNAGIRRDALMMWMKNEEWFDVIQTNLHGFFFITRRLLKDMLINKYGRIVNVVSLSGIKGLPGQANYSAAKAGVIGATKALAQETGKKNVTVNAVAPGFIKTDMVEGIDENQVKAMIPLGRFGKPEEVAEVVAFLASEKSSYVTGEVISVNGGLYT
jgi:3-oxoacyl-[acyl-carrier protein] reductase